MPAFGSAGLSVTGLASIVYAFLKAIAPFIFCSFFFKANARFSRRKKGRFFCLSKKNDAFYGRLEAIVSI
jgi:hypothetical protein